MGEQSESEVWALADINLTAIYKQELETFREKVKTSKTTYMQWLESWGMDNPDEVVNIANQSLIRSEGLLLECRICECARDKPTDTEASHFTRDRCGIPAVFTESRLWARGGSRAHGTLAVGSLCACTF